MVDPQRWRDLCTRVNAKGDVDAVHDDLVARHAESHRAYHTLAHVAFCLDEFERVRSLAAKPNEAEMALWFHDAVYEPTASDNEARSATLARQACMAMKLPHAFSKRVYHLVIATQHAGVPSDPDAQLVADIDLAVLGQPPADYDAYERRVRREYSDVSDVDFWTGRAAILRKLLSRPRVYATDPFHARYEEAARANLARSIEGGEARML